MIKQLVCRIDSAMDTQDAVVVYILYGNTNNIKCTEGICYKNKEYVTFPLSNTTTIFKV